MDFLRVALDSDIDSALDEIGMHQLDQSISASLKREYAFAHEIREDNAIRYRRVLKSRTVRIRDRLHEQTNDVFTTRKEPIEQFARRHSLIVVEVHAAGRIE